MINDDLVYRKNNEDYLIEFLQVVCEMQQCTTKLNFGLEYPSASQYHI